MYVCTYVIMYVCTYVRTYVCTYVRKKIKINKNKNKKNVCTYVRIVCTYVRMYVCMYVCILYVCTYIPLGSNDAISAAQREGGREGCTHDIKDSSIA